MTDRLGLQERSELSSAQQEAYDEMSSFAEGKYKGIFKARDEHGRLLGPFGILLHPPSLAKAYIPLAKAIAGIGGLPAEAKETAILVVGATTGAKYETYAHEPVSGFSRAELDTILSGSCPDSFEGSRRTSYNVTKGLFENGPLKKELYDEAIQVEDVAAEFQAFGKEGTITLIHVVGLYKYVATLLNGFDASTPDS